ncbi:MAG TPA: hypothetical protein VKA70_00480 [Blastocatellia bacterium]|nr:hypothetical protein [Blastocatellia bacterium]
MKNTYRFLCVLIFLVGVDAYSQVQNSTTENDKEPALPFVATYVQYSVSPDGVVNLTGWSTRYVNRNGEWRIVMHGLKKPAEGDSSESPVFAGTPEGIIGKAGSYVHKGSGIFAPDSVREAYRSHSYLKSLQTFARTVEIAGVKAYVLRDMIKDREPNNSLEWAEQTYSPRTGYNPLKMVLHYKDGSEMVQEAIRIDFRDVPEDLNKDLKNLSK